MVSKAAWGDCGVWCILALEGVKGELQELIQVGTWAIFVCWVNKRCLFTEECCLDVVQSMRCPGNCSRCACTAACRAYFRTEVGRLLIVRVCSTLTCACNPLLVEQCHLPLIAFFN
jgi:hypothetical protein